MARGTHSMLRLALLCHLSVAGAVRLATNVACLPYEANEVFLDLSGARATAFPIGVPQADALGRLWRRLGVAAQQLGRGGWAGLRGQGFTASRSPLPRLPGQEARRHVLDGNGCVGPQHAGPQGVRLPHRAPRRACAVFGNVIDPASVLRVKDINGGALLPPGVVIDLHIVTTTAYTANRRTANHMKDVDGINTFGEINLKGPGSAGATSSVGLTFTFKRRDTNAEVEIPWMQFTLFDFDQIKADTSIASGYPSKGVNADGVKGQEVPPHSPTPTTPRHPHPPTPSPHAIPPSLRIAPTDPRSRGA